MTFNILFSPPNPNEIKKFVSIYKSLLDWTVIKYRWNPTLGGFWQVEQFTSDGFKKEEKAIKKALQTAATEDVPFWYAGYTPEKHKQLHEKS